MTETDPRVEIVARALVDRMDDPALSAKHFRIYVDDARAILAALDAAWPVEPPADEEVAWLVEQLSGRYPVGQRLPNGEPEFGWRQFAAEPINIKAAFTISRLSAEVARLKAERDEARSLHNACTEARDSAGYLGTVVYCIEDLHARATAAEAEAERLTVQNARLTAQIEGLTAQNERLAFAGADSVEDVYRLAFNRLRGRHAEAIAKSEDKS